MEEQKVVRHLWGSVKENTVRRQLNKKDLSRLRKGKKVSIKVLGVTVVLINKEYEHPHQSKLDKLDARIAKLFAKKRALALNKGKV